MPKTQMVTIDKIKVMGQQTRVRMDPEKIREYAAHMKMGDKFPPIDIFWDAKEKEYHMGDGCYRLEANLQNGKKQILARIRIGTSYDALCWGAGANATHGLPRSQKDKRNAVFMVLERSKEEGKELTDNNVAKICKVSFDLAKQVRLEKFPEKVEEPAAPENGEEPAKPARRIGSDNKSYPVPGARKRKGAVSENGNSNYNPDEVQDPTDFFGTVLPKGLRKVFCDPWYGVTLEFLEQSANAFRKARLSDGYTKRAELCEFPKPGRKDFIDCVGFISDYYDKLIEHIRTHKPAGICPMCNGEKCAQCRQVGLVSREMYQALQEKKKEKEAKKEETAAATAE